jgi:hypothetical protein
MALYCTVLPRATLCGAVGVIAMLLRVALVTVRLAWPDRPPKTAIIVLLPAAMPYANPGKFDPLAIVAAAGLTDDQITDEVISCVVPSANVATALKRVVVPPAIVGAAGVTAMELAF